MRNTFDELRHTLRSLRRRPGFAAVVIATLAIGLGATAAIYTLVRGVLLQPLPYPQPERIVRLLGTRLSVDEGYDTVSYPNVDDWRRQARSFSAVSAYDEWQPFLLGGGEAERVSGASVDAPFFDVLGIQPRLGRFFRADEATPGSSHAVVLSHGLWQRRFGSDETIVGRQLTFSGRSYEVVGVAPAGLEDPALSGPDFAAPELWRVAPEYFAKGSSRDGFAFTALARLRPGTSVETAQAELDRVMASLRAQYPDANADRGVRVVPLQQQIVARAQPALLALLAGTALLLLVAGANVASLMVARALDRRYEVAVRQALGAGTGRVVRQALVESLLLAAAGGVLGLLLANAAIGALLRLAGPELPRAAQVRLDSGVALAAVALSLLVGALVGWLPALRMSATDPGAALAKAGARHSADPGTARLRRGLLAVQVALSLVLLVGAGLMLRTLLALRATDPGFRPAGVLALKVEPPYPEYQDEAQVLALWGRMQERLAALPGVEAVGGIDLLPMIGDFNGMGFTVEGRPPLPPAQEPSVETRVVTPGYFPAAGIRLLRGRLLTPADAAGAHVALVDEAMARQHFRGEDPIGRRIRMFDDTSWEVVGVVGAVRQFALAEPPGATFYLPRAQAQSFADSGGWLLLRGPSDPAALAAAARQALREIDPDLVVADVRPLSRVVAATAARARLQAALLAAFAAMALLLAAVGVYGLVAASVTARGRELAIRSALGARRHRLVGRVVGEGLLPVAAGALCGLLAAAALTRGLAASLYGVAAADPWTFAAAPLLLAAVAAAAAWLPARRAAGGDPVRVLREE